MRTAKKSIKLVQPLLVRLPINNGACNDMCRNFGSMYFSELYGISINSHQVSKFKWYKNIMFMDMYYTNGILYGVLVDPKVSGQRFDMPGIIQPVRPP